MRWRLAWPTGWLAATAAIYFACFTFLKHDPRTAHVIPFAGDPYDSVTSFAAILSIPLCLLAALRTTWAFSDRWDAERALYLQRAQLAVALSIVIATAADGVAMARSPEQWLGSPGAPWIEVAVVGPFALSLVGLWGATAWRKSASAASLARGFAASAAAIALFVGLSLFPEGLVRSVPGEIAALATGVLLLVWPLAAALRVAAPGAASPGEPRGVPLRPILAAVALGAALGASLFLVEAFEHGDFRVGRPLLVAGAFIGGSAFGLGSACFFLARPLRFPFRATTVTSG